jgi:hypothetical protein
MGQRLVNVRLDEERVRKARKLRERGVVLSDLVREAIDARFEQVRRPRTARDLDALMARIFEQYPDPPDLPRAAYNVYDSTEAREAIRRRLRRRRR